MKLRLLAAAALMTASLAASAGDIFFDDFSEPDVTALRAAGWVLRDKAGHPGIEGSRWAPEGVSLVADETQAANRLLRLTAHTDGTGPGTEQVQLCHARKYLNGTYAARVRFDYDPDYSELDWEYLPYGGWDETKPRLYGVSWHTVRLDPWDAYNQAHQEFGFLKGWHVLMTQVADGQVRWFLDGRELVKHGGRNHPVVPMAISFSNWFIRQGPFASGANGTVARQYQQDVDWVFHAKDVVMSTAQVLEQVQGLRAHGNARVDTVPASGLESRCDL